MPRGSLYGSTESDLSHNDQKLLNSYREFQEALRKQKLCPFTASSIAEHKQNIKHKEISIATQDELINELLRFHGWARIDREELRAHHVQLIELVTSYNDLYAYCQFLKEERGVQLWTMNKICQAIISVNKYMKTKVPNNMSEIEGMLKDTKNLYASIWRCAQPALHERPSLCELRERGMALSFLDIIKVHAGQNWRVRTLSTISKQTKSMDIKKSIKDLLVIEVERLAVIQTLLRYPTRKVEAQRSVIEKVGDSWRLKLSASDRKRNKYPINVKLSRMDAQIFNFLEGSKGSKKNESYLPFEGMDITKILKSVTIDMTGVAVTVTGLRSAAESHVDMISFEERRDDIQKALSYAEGHSESIAKMFYKRNGSESIMKAWTSNVNKLMNIHDVEDDNDIVDRKILDSISSSQERWVKGVQSIVQSSLKNPATSKSSAKETLYTNSTRKRRSKFSVEEDEELRKRIRLHGEGNWKDIYDNSRLFQDRYKDSSDHKAREALRERWRRGLNIQRLSVAQRHEWTTFEDSALEKSVSEYGTSWKVILDNNKIFRDMYDHVPDGNARAALKDRWRHLTSNAGPSRDRDRLKLKSPVRVSEHRRKKKGRIPTLNKTTSREFWYSPAAGDEKLGGKSSSKKRKPDAALSNLETSLVDNKKSESNSFASRVTPDPQTDLKMSKKVEYSDDVIEIESSDEDTFGSLNDDESQTDNFSVLKPPPKMIGVAKEVKQCWKDAGERRLTVCGHNKGRIRKSPTVNVQRNASFIPNNMLKSPPETMSRQEALTPAKKLKRIPYTKEEKNTLLLGVEQFGKGNWGLIRNRFASVFDMNSRTNVNLKDLYRTLETNDAYKRKIDFS